MHSARLYVQDVQANCILKLDFRNAFNTRRQDKMMGTVLDFAPSLYPSPLLLLSSPSLLFWSDRTILSSEGVLQSDPLSSLLFYINIHPLISQLKS